MVLMGSFLTTPFMADAQTAADNVTTSSTTAVQAPSKQDNAQQNSNKENTSKTGTANSASVGETKSASSAQQNAAKNSSAVTTQKGAAPTPAPAPAPAQGTGSLGISLSYQDGTANADHPDGMSVGTRNSIIGYINLSPQQLSTDLPQTTVKLSIPKQFITQGITIPDFSSKENHVVSTVQTEGDNYTITQLRLLLIVILNRRSCPSLSLFLSNRELYQQTINCL